MVLGATILLHSLPGIGPGSGHEAALAMASHKQVVYDAAKDVARLISALEAVEDHVLHSAIGVSHYLLCSGLLSQSSKSSSVLVSIG